MRCSRHFAAISASVNFDPTTGMSERSFSRCGMAPMWSSWAWVTHQRLDVVEAVLDVPQVGQDQVDAGLVVAGEQHAAVDDQQPAEVLENGHVAADFADTAQRGHAQTARGQRPGRRQIGAVAGAELPVRHCHRSTPAARMSAASSSICSRRSRAPAATAAHRRRCPAVAVPSLAIVTPPSRFWASLSAPSATWILRAVAMSPECERRQHVSQLTGRDVSPDADEARWHPSPATAGSARRRRSSRPCRSRP